MATLTREEALERLHEITIGIDKEETSHPNGWWETAGGLNFGISVLQELESLIIELTEV